MKYIIALLGLMVMTTSCLVGISGSAFAESTAITITLGKTLPEQVLGYLVLFYIYVLPAVNLLIGLLILERIKK